MQFVRDCISHRASSGNIGFVPTCSENERAGFSETDESIEMNIIDSSLPCSSILEVASSEVTNNNQTISQNLDLKRVHNDQLSIGVNKSPVKKKKNVDREIDIAILKLLKEDNKKKSCNVSSSEPDAEASFGNSIAHTLRSFDNYHKALAKMKITEVLFQMECELPLSED